MYLLGLGIGWDWGPGIRDNSAPWPYGLVI
jgi:hypothetical protein